MATKKMSIAASSPSRAPLEIVRQVPVVKTTSATSAVAAASSKPTILQEEGETGKHLQAIPHQNSEQEAIVDHEK